MIVCSDCFAEFLQTMSQLHFNRSHSEPGLFVYDFTPGCHDTSNIYAAAPQYYHIDDDLQARWCTDSECADCTEDAWPDRNGELEGHYVLNECHSCADEDSPEGMEFTCSFMLVECPGVNGILYNSVQTDS